MARSIARGEHKSSPLPHCDVSKCESFVIFKVLHVFLGKSVVRMFLARMDPYLTHGGFNTETFR